MGYKVADRFRKNELSVKPGGYIVEVEYHDGRRFEYDKVKYPNAYIKKLLLNPKVKLAKIKS